MVQYEGHVTKEGELVVKLEGTLVSLHEFLRSTRLGSRRLPRRSASEGQGVRGRNFSVAK